MNGHIDSRLAAQIVEQATVVLPFDINVMDAKSAVVASTDSARIGTLHIGERAGDACGWHHWNDQVSQPQSR
ncbi:hypothetical protein LGN12_30345 [Burkholderia multivorans]|nr:hypothetical protein [Burkholderia multivorans]